MGHRLLPRSDGTNTPGVHPKTPDEYLQLGIKHHEANRLEESALCFERSAKEQGGCGVGMLMYGLSLRHGWGCLRNEKSGFHWLKKAAQLALSDLEKGEQGTNAMAIRVSRFENELVDRNCEFKDFGIVGTRPRDIRSGAKFLSRLGSPQRQEDGGRASFRPTVFFNTYRFQSYFQVAANLGDPDAQQSLAFCLAHGKGCKKDRKEAAKWYRAAVCSLPSPKSDP